MSDLAGKILMSLFWVVAIINYGVDFKEPMGSILYVVTGIIVLLHVFEIIVYRERIDKADGGLIYNTFMTLLFGLFHIRSLEEVASDA